MQQTHPFKKARFFSQLWGYALASLLFLLTSNTLRAEDIKIEAESATLNGVATANSIAGYSGSGYVWEFDNDGDNVTFTFPAQAGQYELAIQYTAPYGEKGYDLLVNSASSSAMFTGTGDTFASVKAGTFQLIEGQNTVTISKGWGYYGIDYIVLTPVVSTTIKLEGEGATLNGVEVVTTTPGYSGIGYVWGFDQDTDNIVFTFPAKAGEYELVIQYYSPYGEKGYTLQVNSAASEQKFPGTGESFGSVTVGKFQLLEGQNTVTITKNWGYYGIDYIAFTPKSADPPIIVPIVDGKAEAEKAALTGVSVSISPAGYSGTGYVTGFDDATDKLTFNFNIAAGLYEISIGYTSPYGEKGYDLQVNAERGGGMFPADTAFGLVKAGKFLLQEGLNTVTIGRGWGYFGIDYILLTPTTAPLPVKPPKLLSDAHATNPTRSLFSYIVDLYGSKVLSGQHDDVDYILSKTGKEPAIGSFDLIEYSPSRIEFGSNPAGTSEKYIAWAKKGEGNGILSLMWHWNAPTDLINEPPDKLWWSGFYTRATTFDLAAVLADKKGERYGLLLRDIDSIAVQLKKFRDANIPVLWRPLHEAPGGWFWWGAKGADPFKELWRIMYNRLTKHHNLHNLIWVYTGTTDMNWYPGDAYVDIVGPDIYTDPSANLSGDWAAMQDLFGGKKLVALTETGNLPVPVKIRGYGTWWSWFTVWTGDDYIKKQPLDLLQAVYNDQDIITRDELPDWRTYGSPTVAITAPANNAQFYPCQTPVLKTDAADADGTVTKVIFRANGNVIGTDNDAQGGWQLNWTGAAIGTYTVTAEATDNEGFVRLSAPVMLIIKADDQPPLVTAPADLTVNSNTIMCTTWLNVETATATDNCEISSIKGVRSDKLPLDAFYPLGTTSITWTAVDKTGNASQAVQTILVMDSSKPVVLVWPLRTVLRSPNHQYRLLHVRDFVIGALDNCSGIMGSESIRIKQVSSDEAENAPNSGDTAQDIIISADCQSVKLRAERADDGNGRVYTIEVEATDQAGNSGNATYQVLVPIRRNRTSVADAIAYTIYSDCGNPSSLARVELDGETNTAASNEVLTVYPNPANGSYLNVSVYADNSQEATVALVSTVAQEVMSMSTNLQAGTNQIQIPIDKATNGIYLLVVNKDNQRITKKVVISR